MINVSDAFPDLTQTNTFAVIGNSTENFQVVQSIVGIKNVTGVFEPLPARELILKPEGQRAWKWWTLYTQEFLQLGWLVQDQQGLQFRVMEVDDWRQFGYRAYKLAQAPLTGT